MSQQDFPGAYEAKEFDADRYLAEVLSDHERGRCFICELVHDVSPDAADIVYRDELCIAFFPRLLRLLGYVLVAPIEHRTSVVDAFSEDEYVALQRCIHKIGKAIARVVPTERLYVFSFGSNQGIDHVHWHLAPLPADIPFEQQQFAAISRNEYLDIPPGERAALAEQMRTALREAEE